MAARPSVLDRIRAALENLADALGWTAPAPVPVPVPVRVPTRPR
jgi:hypothetical protein